MVHVDKVQSLSSSLQKETDLRLLAEQRAQDAALRIDVLLSTNYFNEKEKEYDRYISPFTCVFLLAK